MAASSQKKKENERQNTNLIKGSLLKLTCECCGEKFVGSSNRQT